MKKYSKMYQLTNDIDWFCKIGNVAMHFASNCGMLPSKVNNKEVNSGIQKIVAMMGNVVEDIEHIAINWEHIYMRVGDNNEEGGYENYVRSFMEMAMKGFLSFDRDLNSEDTYVWIARPDAVEPVPIEDIPTYEGSVRGLWATMREEVHVWCLNDEQ